MAWDQALPTGSLALEGILQGISQEAEAVNTEGRWLGYMLLLVVWLREAILPRPPRSLISRSHFSVTDQLTQCPLSAPLPLTHSCLLEGYEKHQFWHLCLPRPRCWLCSKGSPLGG